MIRRYTQAIRTVPNAGALNMADSPGTTVVPGQASLTNGTSLVDVINLQPPPSFKDWQILEVSISAYIGLAIHLTGSPPFGRLGRVFAGLSLELSPPASTVSYDSPMKQLPQNQDLISVIWDPTTNSLPPITPVVMPQTPPAVGNMSAVKSVIIPPQPIPVKGAQTVCFGLWIEPALLVHDTGGNSPQIYVASLGTTIDYDIGM